MDNFSGNFDENYQKIVDTFGSVSLAHDKENIRDGYNHNILNIENIFVDC
jgi:hypothetical protein